MRLRPAEAQAGAYDRIPTWPALLANDTDYYEGGHDLVAVPESRRLLLTTDLCVWDYDIDLDVRVHAALDLPLLKSISQHPLTGRYACAQQTKSWWTDTGPLCR